MYSEEERFDPSMIGILLITHGQVGASLLAAARHILAQDAERVATLSAGSDENPEEVEARARQLVAELDGGSGVLILTDVYGATPCNIAARLLEPERVAVLAGVNLPMLLRALTYRVLPLYDFTRRVLAANEECVFDVGEKQ